MRIALCSSRTLLFILGLLFLAATVVVWGLSGFILATYKQISSFSVSHLTWVPAMVMIFVGIILVVAGISGCITSCGGSKKCSITFFIFVALTFVALVTAMAMVFVYKRQIHTRIDQDANTTFNEYGETGFGTLTNQVDFVQLHMHCCGTDNYTSWEHSKWGANHTNSVPISCCKNSSECFGGNLEKMHGKVSEYIYTDGCVQQVEVFLQRNMQYLAGGTIGFLIILFLGMIASCVVFCKKDDNPYFNLA